MRVLGAIFSALFLAAGIDVGSSLPNSGVAFPVNPHSLAVETVESKRLLRSYEADSEDEERAGGQLGLVDKFAAKVMQKLYKNPSDVFKRLKLKDVNLENNKVFEGWLVYVNKFRQVKGVENFPDQALFNVIHQSQYYQRDLVPLFQSLTHVQGMKDLARTMQFKLFEAATPATRTLMNKAWLEGFDTSDDVFHILKLQDGVFDHSDKLIQWLKFSDMYKKLPTSQSTSWLDELNLVLKTKKPNQQETKFGLLFQALKEEKGMETIAGKMESQLFERWMKMDSMTPDKVGGMLGGSATTNWKRIFEKLEFTDDRYIFLKAYTEAYAANRGANVLKSVEKLFAENKPVAALERAIKA
ncbi:hypothetical protein DVH05_022588 [Phytophthora capsici]|nr:hypothetical protein DVH05_022588 [Phytophthora capsici]